MSLKPPVSPTTGVGSVFDDRLDVLESVELIAADPTGVAATDTTALQVLINTIDSHDGGTLVLQAGTYAINTALRLCDNLTIRGAGKRLTILQLDNDVNEAILNVPVSGSTFLAVNDFTLSDLTLDGDAPNTNIPSATGTAGLLHAYQTNRWHIARCRFMQSRGYGVGLQGTPTASDSDKRGPHADTYFEDCEFISNGKVADTDHDGIDVKSCERFSMVGCYAYDNGDKGFNVRGQWVTLTGCTAELNGTGYDMNGANSSTDTDDVDSYFTLQGCHAESNVGSGFAVTSSEDTMTHASLTGCNARKNGGSGVGTTEPASTGEIRLSITGGSFVDNTIRGIGTVGCQNLTITGAVVRDNDADGIRLTDQPQGASIVGCDVRSNGAFGIRSTGTSDQVSISDCTIKSNSSGAMSLLGNLNRAARNNIDDTVPTAVASAASISLVPRSDYFSVTGTADITSITASYAGRVVTLRFASTAATNGIVDGSNLKLASTLAYTADDTITLICDGTNWHEIARSVN